MDNTDPCLCDDDTVTIPSRGYHNASRIIYLSAGNTVDSNNHGKGRFKKSQAGLFLNGRICTDFRYQHTWYFNNFRIHRRQFFKALRY